MKLRNIRLDNVRRFVAPVEIRDIGDGLNILSAPNEHGKSTMLDALHAVFFKNRKAWDSETRSLVPHAGGDPAIAVEAEFDDGTYRIRKTWNPRRRGEAEVLKSGQLVAQADAAEWWIAERLKSPKDGGPAGLLWVRQGFAGLDEGGADNARRNLMTSVAGEVEAMTGGRRMNDAMERCDRELGRFLTPTGRPKQDSPVRQADAEIERLEKRQAELREVTARLSEGLRRRRQLRRERDELVDPAGRQEREARLAEAEAAHEQARRHAEGLERVRQSLDNKRIETERADEKVAELAGRLDEAKAAESAREAAVRHEAAAATARAGAERQLKGADAIVAESEEQEAKSMKALRTAQEFALARSAGKLRKDLVDRLDRAAALAERIAALSAETRAEIRADVLEDLELRHANLEVLRRTRDAEAPTVTMTYLPGRSGGVALDGDPLPEGVARSIPEGAVLAIEGVGELAVDPGRRAGGEELAEAAREFARALASAGVDGIDAAWDSGRRRLGGESRIRDARTELEIVASDGIDALREELAALPAPEERDEEGPSVEEAEEAHRIARERLSARRRELEATRESFRLTEAAAIEAAGTLAAADARLERARAPLADIDDPEAERRRMATRATRLRTELDAAEARYREEKAGTPDMDGVETTLERARSIVEAANGRIRETEIELAGLDASIGLQAGKAVHEELADVKARLEAECRRRDGLRFEVDVLVKLRDALQSARAKARDRYVAPVLEELVPLLRNFWPEAGIELNAETALPEKLVRPGAEEDFDVLSGGTREQIALLVRLAFARLLMKSGYGAPIILDDAIVFTDDDRIELMFDALTRQARDIQVIVLTCRQKAFRDLGANNLSIRATGG